MLNKSNRNKIKIRSTKKKQKRRTKKNVKYGGQPESKNMIKADYPTMAKESINDIGFEIPDREGFNAKMDNYKFLEMADRSLTMDMKAKLSKYEKIGDSNHYCKYMYLIRATYPGSLNTVLHYICFNKNIQMLQIVWPYYLVLYNERFPELLKYYITKKNSEGKTPMDLLDDEKGGGGDTLDHKSKRLLGSLGAVKNSAKKLSSITSSLGNMTFDRAGAIRGILQQYVGKTSDDLSSGSGRGAAAGAAAAAGAPGAAGAGGMFGPLTNFAKGKGSEKDDGGDPRSLKTDKSKYSFDELFDELYEKLPEKLPEKFKTKTFKIGTTIVGNVKGGVITKKSGTAQITFNNNGFIFLAQKAFSSEKIKVIKLTANDQVISSVEYDKDEQFTYTDDKPGTTSTGPVVKKSSIDFNYLYFDIKKENKYKEKTFEIFGQEIGKPESAKMYSDNTDGINKNGLEIKFKNKNGEEYYVKVITTKGEGTKLEELKNENINLYNSSGTSIKNGPRKTLFSYT